MAITFTQADMERAPSLQRLLTPEETLLYTVSFHPLRGWWLLLGALLCAVGSAWWLPALLGCVVLSGLWYIPLHTNEVAVTNDRLLLRTGWLHLLLETIEDQNLLQWKMEQNAVGSIFDAGTVIIRIREAASSREIVLNWVWHPVTFLEALQTMQDEKYRDAT